MAKSSLIMSRLLIRTFCQTQTARGLSRRLLSTGILQNNRASALAHNDLRESGLPLFSDVLHTTHLIESSCKLKPLLNQPIASDPILFVKEPTQTPGREPSGASTSGDASDKVLSTREVVDKENRASLDQLNVVADLLTKHLPQFFAEPHPFFVYSKDVVFIDRTRSVRTQGVGPYTMQIAMAKAYYCLNYTSNKLELLNLVKDPEESCIKIRYHDTEIWRDALSTLYINKEGKIYCHVCDNIDVEKDSACVKKVVKNPLVNRGVHV